MEDGEKRIALCSLYLLFGIAMIAMSFNLVQEEVLIISISIIIIVVKLAIVIIVIIVIVIFISYYSSDT